MKKIIIFVTMILSFSLIGNVFAEWQQCDVCNVPAKEFIMYKNFIEELLNRMNLVIPNWKYIGNYWNPGFFQAWIYKIPEKTKKTLDELKKNLLENAKIQAKNALAIFVFWWNFIKDGGVSIFSNFSIFKQNKAFLKIKIDIDDLDTKIHSKELELIFWWWYSSKISKENHDYLDEIFKKYSEWDNKIFSEYNFPEEIKYSDLFQLLENLNQKMKIFSVWSFNYDKINKNWFIVNPFQDWGKIATLMDTKLNRKFYWKLVFDNDYIKTLSEKYKCWRFSLDNPLWCSEAWKNFMEWITKIYDSFWEELDKSKKNIDIAIRNFWSINVTTNYRNPQNKKTFIWLTEKEKTMLKEQWDLLRALYWINFNKDEKLLDVRTDTEDIVQKFWITKNTVNNWINSIKNWTNEISNIKNTMWTKHVDWSIYKNVNIKKITEMRDGFYKFEKQMFDTKINNKWKFDISAVSTTQASLYFLWIFEKIKSINNIIWDKSSENTLIYNLWDACKKQCSNKKWLCYY